MTKIPHNAMRATGENDRPDAFKTECQKFVNGVNDWLKVIADFADKGEPLNGEIIRLKPLISITRLGRLSTGGVLHSTEHTPGISLTGDGVETPLELQAVTIATDGSKQVTVVTGSDPISPAAHGGYSHSHQLDIVAGVSRETYYPDNAVNSELTLLVMGNGNVKRQYVDINGVSIGQSLQTAGEVAILAAEAFSILSEVAPAR